MIKHIIISIVVLSVINYNIYAQEIFSWSKETGYCTPSVVGLPRPKAFVFQYELQPKYKITSTVKDGNFQNTEGEINRNRRLDFRLRFPIINKSSLTIAAGLKYSREEFRFDNYPTGSKFYDNLENRDLKSIGAHLYVVKPTKSNKYFILRAGLDFNGDYPSDEAKAGEFLKFSIAPLIGWKKNDNLSYAVGFSYGYAFGRPLIYPVVSYNKNFNCHWGIESLLPVSLKVRYTKNEKNYFYGGFELKGNSYRLDDPDSIFIGDKLHLFHSELRFTVTYERELHDWLWFGIEAGARHNLTFNVTNGPKANSDVILKNKLSGAGLINGSIFIVPPRGFFRKSTGL
jgi:hypothetical protein